MTRIVLRRLLWSVPLLFVVSILTFVLLALTPGDPAATIVGTSGTPDQYKELRQQLGLNHPLYVQYWHWLHGVLHGTLGTSLFTGAPVASLLDSRLPVTLSLMLGAGLLSAALGVSLGTAAALSQRTWVRRIVDAVSLLGMAIPNFWLALVLVAVFAVSYRVFPATGYVPFAISPGSWAQSLVLPWITLAVAGTASIAKQSRDAMLDVLRQDFIRTLRAAGVPERSIVLRHALRNAAIPVVTVIGILLVGTLSGTVFVEAVFVLPGLGGLAVQATTQHDIPVVQGVALYFTLFVVAINLVVDLAYSWLNPKVRTA
jgi:peptide/nickel transport system permease protein